jgi:type II secretory pathway component PulC
MIQINANLQQRVTLVLCGILGVLVCLTVIYMLQQWHNDWRLAHQELIKTANTSPQKAKENLLAAIPSEHVFGQSFSETGSAPITNLQLRVTGIMSVTPEENGSLSKAYISMAGQSSKIYRTGDSLPYGVKIYAITPDTVILENEGHLEKLALLRERLEFKPKNIKGSS